MDVFEAVRTVLAIRSYDNRAVPPEVTRKIAEAAHLTASSQNGQPWEFVFVEDKEMLRRLGETVKSGPYIADAALAVAVAVESGNRFGVSDGSRAIQSMVLTAWSEGVGSNWAGFVGGLGEVNELLGIPETYDVLAVVPFGYPARQVGAGKKQRKNFSEVIHKERFRQPFEI